MDKTASSMNARLVHAGLKTALKTAAPQHLLPIDKQNPSNLDLVCMQPCAAKHQQHFKMQSGQQQVLYAFAFLSVKLSLEKMLWQIKLIGWLYHQPGQSEQRRTFPRHSMASA